MVGIGGNGRTLFEREFMTVVLESKSVGAGPRSRLDLSRRKLRDDEETKQQFGFVPQLSADEDKTDTGSSNCGVESCRCSGRSGAMSERTRNMGIVRF